MKTILTLKTKKKTKSHIAKIILRTENVINLFKNK